MRVQRSRPSMPTAIMCNEDGVANHTGTLTLLELADRSGLTRAMNEPARGASAAAVEACAG